MATANGHSTPFRIAIVGGGIGGLFCALSIHHHCLHDGVKNVQIDIYEQASQYKEIGAGIGIGINAARLVHQLGLGGLLNTFAGRETGAWFSFRRFDDSREIFTIPVDDSQIIKAVPCARSVFLDLLLRAVIDRNAATLHTRKNCLRIEEKDDRNDSVTLHFADNSISTADLVIASDGIHSTLRKQFTPDAPIFSGVIAYRGIVPTAQLPTWPFPNYNIIWLTKGKHFLVFSINGDRDLCIVAYVTKGEEEAAGAKESWTSLCDRSEVERDFEEFDERYVHEIIRLMPERPSRWRINDRRPLDRWHYLDGRVVFLGDAAHAMEPHAAAGAGQALEDGWVLARAVSEYLASARNVAEGSRGYFESLESVAEFYQAIRLPRAQKAQVTSRMSGRMYQLRAEGMEGKTFEECCEILVQSTQERMRWVWDEDLDAAYEAFKQRQT